MNDQNKGLDIERVKQIALDNGFQLKEQASGNYDLHSYVYQFAEKLLEDKQAEVNELKAKLAKYEDPSPENLVAFSHAMYRRLASWASGQIPKELADLNLDDFVPMYAASAAVHSLTMDWTKETTHVIVPREPTPKMIDATWDIDDEIQEMSHNARNEAIYKHMIAAAQKHNQ